MNTIIMLLYIPGIHQETVPPLCKPAKPGNTSNLRPTFKCCLATIIPAIIIFRREVI